jgi:hypothetical protein
MTRISAINDARVQIKTAAETVLALLPISSRDAAGNAAKAADEAVDNVMLAYRHLEDASMRLGKAIQALDGGVSVYDKRTTVGA